MNKLNGSFYHTHIISADQFEEKDIHIVFEKARGYKKRILSGEVITDLAGKILCALFYEPSSRTFSSFIAAMQRLGGGIIPIQDTSVSSVAKGETLDDTIRVFGSYADAIALRHSEEGAVKKASAVSTVPVINAGDGTGEHPTQALLDVFTIYERMGRIEGLEIALVGDLKYGRTVHSLTKLLSLYKNITLHFVSPEVSAMPPKILKKLKELKISFKTHASIVDVIERVDVIYMTRVQKERMDEATYKRLKDAFILNSPLVQQMKQKAIIMHPLPRINEITADVDADPRAVYFSDQIKNGMFVRMALLRLILRK